MPAAGARSAIGFTFVGGLAVACLFSVSAQASAITGNAPGIGRYEIHTVPIEPGVILRSATFTPAGKILVNFARSEKQDRRQVELATMDYDGHNMRTFFSGIVPVRPKDNGLRFMIFPDNKRIFMGDYVLECVSVLENCSHPTLVPVTYPKEVADGPHVMYRWSEMIVAPDNHHVAWTTLFNNGAAAAFTAELRKQGAGYVMAMPRIVSTLDPFIKDPKHADGVIPQPTRGGEVKQFVHGGTAISAVGAGLRDTPDSTVLNLATGEVERITDTPGYTETTIFSPDERLGVTMTTRFSQSDPAILGLMPRPYPGALNVGLAWAAYTYGVTGVRAGRLGNIGPALIEIAKSKVQPGYQGVNLSTSDEWVFNSPLSWHPNGTMALWPESRRGDRAGSRRIQMVRLLDYKPRRPVQSRLTSTTMPQAISDLSVLNDYAAEARAIDVKVYGKGSGYIRYRRSAEGGVEKIYADFNDGDGQVYSGQETMQANPHGESTYTADVRLTGPHPGTMALKITFGPLSGPLPAEVLFTPGNDGKPRTRGYVEYDGRRIEAASMVP